MNRISTVFYQEVCNYFGVDPTKTAFQMGNCWANINDKTAWNRPHLHNGCWYSGVFYIHADGDEGDFVAMDSYPDELTYTLVKNASIVLKADASVVLDAFGEIEKYLLRKKFV